MGGRADVWTCYRAHADGFGRIAIGTRDVSAQDLGRTVERLLAIEDAYHLTLLPLPIARDVKPQLAVSERRMVQQLDAVRRADSVEEKRTVLDALLQLAADVEHIRARVSNRFAGSSAYFSLLESRFGDLREDKIEHVLSLSRFVMRRVRPAAETIGLCSNASPGCPSASPAPPTCCGPASSPRRGTKRASARERRSPGKAAAEAPAGGRRAVGRRHHLLRLGADRPRPEGNSEPWGRFRPRRDARARFAVPPHRGVGGRPRCAPKVPRRHMKRLVRSYCRERGETAQMP